MSRPQKPRRPPPPGGFGMISIKFEIPGRIPGKERSRNSSRGGHYTPDKTRSAETTIALLSRGVMYGPPFKGPVLCKVDFWITPPASWGEKRRLEAIGKFIDVKPDLDNAYKTILDGCEKGGVFARGDSQVAVKVASKRYAARDRVVVSLRSLSA